MMMKWLLWKPFSEVFTLLQTKAIDVAINAKTQRYATCCTMETLLVAQNVAADVLPPLANAFDSAGVELRGCARTPCGVETHR